MDAHCIIQMANKATHTMFGYKKTELRGKNVNILIPPPFAEQHNAFGGYHGMDHMCWVCRRDGCSRMEDACLMPASPQPRYTCSPSLALAAASLALHAVRAHVQTGRRTLLDRPTEFIALRKVGRLCYLTCLSLLAEEA